MKKTIYLITLLCLFIIMESPPPAHAERTDTNTNANISFEPNTGPTQPVDPDNPSIPMPDVPQVSGQLAIVFASSFNFGTGTVSPTIQYYNVTTERPNIQIADLRGTGSGWTLDVSVSTFKGENEQDALIGSRIHIKNGRLNSATPLAYAPTVIEDVILTTDNAPARIMEAGTDQGLGLWVNRMYPASPSNDAYVILEVPAGVASTGAYTATITWTLSDIP